MHVVNMHRYAYTAKDRTVRTAIGVVGTVFILAGLWGFVDPSFFGLFDLTATHNWIHIVTGALYAIVAFAPVDLNVTAWTARIGGIVYALLGVAGFVLNDLLAPLLHLGFNENVFHVLVGTALAILGFMLPTGEHVGERRVHTRTLRGH